ncbi:Segregation and condensation protein B [hydrothermal vent metagenome]|uniref:Segregation and condensation protein B n=1 Tax=hydrothermal vent metagenome TaxID=652676 RepID=A0A3B0S5X1_9ZZZZ
MSQDENATLEATKAAVKSLAERSKRLGTEPARQPDDPLRMIEALMFAAKEPLDMQSIRARMPDDVDCNALLARMQAEYAERGVNLVLVADKWRLQSAPDLAAILIDEREEPRKLSNAALETLSIIAYHQPVTRAEIEEVRGVAVSRGTLDLLLEVGWIGLRGRRRTPGRPVTWGTTDGFLAHFCLERIEDLPGKDELKAAGLLDSRVPADFEVPMPTTDGDMDNLLPVDEEEKDGEFHTDYLQEET